MSDQPPYAEYPRPDQGGYAAFGRGPGVYFEAIGESWNLIRQDLGHWIAATLVYFVLSYALSLPITLLTQSMMPRQPSPDQMGQLFTVLGLQMVLNLIPAAVTSTLHIGMISMGVRKARGEYINVAMMFEPFRRFGAVFGSTLLYYVIVLAASLACGIPALFFGPVLLLMPVVAYLRSVGPVESLSLTFDRCKPYWASLLALCIVLGVIIIAGFILCGVGVLLAWPIYCVVLGIHYRAFFESDSAGIPTYPR